MAKLYLPLTLLVLASLVLAVQTAQVVKDKHIILSQIKAKGTAEGMVKPMTDADMITARQMIEGYASLYSLPVEVKLEKHDLRIKIKEAGKEEAEPEPTPEEAKAAKVVSLEKEKLAVLENFDNVTNFFTALSKMPYPLEYKEFCVGADCPNVFDVTIAQRNLAEQQSSAPPQAQKATAPPTPASKLES